MIRRIGWIACCVPALALTLLAAPSVSSAQGMISGTAVAEETGRPLQGALVEVQNTLLRVTTDAEGRFQLASVPAGTHALTLRYLGRETQTQSVTVEARGSATVRFNVPIAAIALEGLTVLGARAMVQAEALNRQKNAPNIANVVASDQITRFPDTSAPEAVQRLPGVALARDQGEGRYIQIRGGSAANTQVSYNGVQIPAPEGEVRQIALDAIPVDILESITVWKTLLPDLDADALGGAVNLTTRRAPAARLMSFEGAGGLATIRDQASGSGALTFGDRFANGKLGLLLSGSYSRRQFGSDNLEPAYDLGDAGLSDDALEEMQVRHYTIMRARTGGTATLDYRPHERSLFTFSGLYSRLEDDEQRRALIHVVADDELVFEHKNRNEYQEIMGGMFGGRHLFGRGLELDYQLSFTRAQEIQPYENTVAFLQSDVSFSPNISDPGRIQSNPAAGAISGAYLFAELEEVSYDAKDTDRVGALNLTVPYRLGAQGAGRLKLGVKLRNKNKVQDQSVIASELNGGGDIVLGTDVGARFGRSIRYPGSYPLPPFATAPGEVKSFRSRFAARLDVEESLEGQSNDYDIDERVAAAYLMSELQLTSALMLLPGVRYEHTKAKSMGFDFDPDAETLTEQRAEKSYGRFFPMVHLRYGFSARTNLRAAFTNTIARPNFVDLVPYRIRDDEDLAIGNPDLEPTTARHLDLLLEHYDDRIGVLSAGLFYKRLTDPIFVFTEENTLGGETEQPRNGESGTILGVELAAQKQLRFLPGALSGLGLFANYTYTDSDAQLPGGRKARLQGQADHVFNTALSYDRRGFTGQLSLNYHDDYVDEYGGDAGDPDEHFEDVYVDRRLQLDFSASQRVNGRATIFLELINLTNEPYRVFQGVTDRPIQMEYYERWGRLGLRYTW
jgi:TonB-dependent receptor